MAKSTNVIKLKKKKSENSCKVNKFQTQREEWKMWEVGGEIVNVKLKEIKKWK